MQSTQNLLKQIPDKEDQEAFDTIKLVLDYDPNTPDNWVNVFLTRYHCKPLSYYLNKYKS